MNVAIRRCWLFIALAAVSTSPLAAQNWIQRTVTSVNGEFSDIQPQFGAEVGLGTSRIQWGVPLSGSFSSFLEFEGYDAFPNQDQPYFFPGQTVFPGQRFEAGRIRFRNGSVATASSTENLTVTLDANVFGSEFLIDTHSLSVDDTWRFAVKQTPNQGTDAARNADYIWFPDFPYLGSFRVNEGRTNSMRLMVKFGSLIPVAFEDIEDPTAGFWVPSIVDDPTAPGVPQDVVIDFPDSLNLGKNGVLPVSIAATNLFDPQDVDLDSIRFGDPAAGGTLVAPVRSALEDVTGDGLLDLTLKFSVPDLVDAGALGPSIVEAFLTGETLAGTSFSGSQEFKVVPKGAAELTAVPEPSGIALTLFGLCLAASARRCFSGECRDPASRTGALARTIIPCIYRESRSRAG
jgi:hypothetical protein